MSTTATHCPYCALQCGMHLSSEQGAIAVHGNAKFPVNRGGLCVKGWTAAATLAHADRLREPLVRGSDGQLSPASWDAALNRVAEAFNRIQTRSGNDAVAVFGSGALARELGDQIRLLVGLKVLEDVPCADLPQVLDGILPYVGARTRGHARS
jgi:assimilatory nitrate reductase catalytic subunit